MFIIWKWLVFMHLEQTLIDSFKETQPKSPPHPQAKFILEFS